MSQRCFIHLAYNGAPFCGWQTQPDALSVQQTLEEALSTLLRQPIGVVGCGRTDSGVHASDFWAHFDVAEGGVDGEQLTFKLNRYLGQDIVIFEIFAVKEDAHARFDAISRTYQYHVSNQKLPFKQGQYCKIFFEPDVVAMNAAAQVLMEYEDFTSFSKLHTQVKTNICHLSKAEWIKEGDEWVFTIQSNRFLRNMVRAVTGTLIEVGRGKLDIEGLRRIVEQKDRCAAGTSMPAEGLFLTKVDYDFEKIKLL